MIALFIILGIIVYLAIGGIMGGLICDDSVLGIDLVLAWLFWPFLILTTVFIILMSFPHELGKKLKRRRGGK